MNSTNSIIARAQRLGLNARMAEQKHGGYRKPSSLGSTYSPLRSIVIEGVGYSHARAQQLLNGLESGKIDVDWCKKHEGWKS